MEKTVFKRMVFLFGLYWLEVFIPALTMSPDSAGGLQPSPPVIETPPISNTFTNTPHTHIWQDLTVINSLFMLILGMNAKHTERLMIPKQIILPNNNLNEVNQNHAAQLVWSNSQKNDAFDLVLFSKSKTHNATNVTKTIQLNNWINYLQ